MISRSGALSLLLLALMGRSVVAGPTLAVPGRDSRPPNIVFMMSDELAYYELGHMGNPFVHTPRIDRMAAEGLRFTQALAVAPVCAPLRCGLMTGKHMGHASVRANDGGTPLRPEEETVASVLKQRGYATGGFGKWGAGGRGSTGVPEAHGFDVFFGYYDQVHAHSYYPPYLIRNSEEVILPGNIGGREGETYSHYAIMDQGLDFIRDHKDEPFFCYLPITPTHGMFDIPADDPAWDQYVDDAWIRDPNIPQDVKNYAAMTTMVDNDLGRVLDLLAELGLEDDTIVFFTGDNGGQDRFKDKEHPRGFFGPNKNPKTGVEFRGGKGSLYEGGLRIPFIARWPGKISPGQVSDLLCYQADVLPTLAELTETRPPADIDGLSIVPTLLGEEAAGRPQEQHVALYWESGKQRAVRIGDWKGVCKGKNAVWALYDLATDPSEDIDIAAENPEVVARMEAFAAASHEEVRPGTYADRTLHERDRAAKWGSSRKGPASKGKASTGKVHEIVAEDRVDPAAIRIVRASSENESNGRIASHAIDGDPREHWHSRFSGELATHPHELVLDLGAVHDIRGFAYLARQDNGWNGAFAETEFSVGLTVESFGDPAIRQTFGKVRTAQMAELERPIRGRFVRIRVLSEVNDGPWASAADIAVLGKVVGMSDSTDDASAAIRTEVIEYKRVGDVALQMHLWAPEEASSTVLRPAIVFFFGGGWKSGKTSQFAPHCERLAAAGYIAMSAEYRVKNRHGTTPFECVKDGKSALRWVRQHAGEFGVDPERIYAGGGSAGGHVAACVGVIDGLDEDGEDLSVSSGVSKLVLFNPVIDTGPAGFGHDRLGDRWKEISPAHHVRPGLPDTLIFHGTTDATVPFSQVESFRDAMHGAANRCTLVEFEGRSHGFFNEGRGDGTDYEKTVIDMIEFLNQR